MMHEKDFDPYDFIESWGKYRDITFAEAASQSLGRIIDKLEKTDEEET
ncbi:MAG: hypothetical protein K2P22_10690 [Lachnospiraceae bacterium]|nr:hypothetical protein [Lachnospiraceae bacterium]